MLPRSWPVACALALLLAGACGAPAGPPVGETVRVEQGEVRGRTDGDVLRFTDLPYAAPPVGALRRVEPRPAPPWSGVRDATGPGSRCPQTAAAPGIPHATAASIDEDCLTVEVTVPAGTADGARLPVLVWLHGGGFSAGAGTDYDPRRLAPAGLVVVTVDYRLGMLGFLAQPGLAGSGAFGLADQRAALGWVARNAAAFGGDPAVVILAGESAGADGVGPLFANDFADAGAPSPFAALGPDLADGITHGAEIPSLFDLRPGPPLTAAQQATATELVTAWARFAATGDPGWPAWSGTGPIRTFTAAGGTDRSAAEYAADHDCDLWNP